MIIKEASVYVDQNVPVYDGNRFMTVRLGVGLKADVEEAQLQAGVKELHARAELLLNSVLAEARTEAQGRLITDLEGTALKRVDQEKDLL